MYKLVIGFVVAFVCIANAQYDNGHSKDSTAEIRSQVNELKPDGNYNYQFETSNGIIAQESGVGGSFVSGSSQYYSPEGELIQLTYTADENGFHPQGAHLPTPPPIPEAILKSLEYIRTHSEQNDEHNYSGAPSKSYIPPGPSNQYLAPRKFH